MAKKPSVPTTPPSDEEGKGTENDSNATFTQEDLEQKIGERLARERKKYSDYEDLKAKAAKLDELEEQQKTEAQKAADRMAAAEKRAEAAERDAMRLRVIAETQLAPELHEFVFGDNEDEMRGRAEKLKATSAGQAPRMPAPDPSQGKSGGGAGDAALNGDPLLQTVKDQLGID